MKIVKMPLSDLQPAERNVRVHSEKQIKEFMRSIEMFGQIRPIVIDEDNNILAGNGLYATLTAMGRTEADCYVAKGLSEKEKKKLMLADNKIYSLGVDDIGVFEDMIRELGDDLDIPGYDLELLETLTADTSDIDEMISGYGTISEETRERIAETGEQYAASEEVHAQTAQEIPAAPEPEEEHGAPLEQRFIICPHCGQRIWM